MAKSKRVGAIKEPIIESKVPYVKPLDDKYWIYKSYFRLVIIPYRYVVPDLSNFKKYKK